MLFSGLSLLVLASSLLAPATSTSFDEVGIIQLVSFDNATSTGKNCTPKDYPTEPPKRYFAVIRNGTEAVISSYSGMYNGTALTASIDDRDLNITLSSSENDTVLVAVQQEEGVCQYTTKVIAGSVLNVTSNETQIQEAGVLTVMGLQNASSRDACEKIVEDVNGTYAFVRTENMTVLGGYWGGENKDSNTTELKHKEGDDEMEYEVTPPADGAMNGTVSIRAVDDKNQTIRDAGGCALSATVMNGSVMGVPAANSSDGMAGVFLRGSKVVCRQTCGPNGSCRTVCRDYWRQ